MCPHTPTHTHANAPTLGVGSWGVVELQFICYKMPPLVLFTDLFKLWNKGNKKQSEIRDETRGCAFLIFIKSALPRMGGNSRPVQFFKQIQNTKIQS